MGRPTGLEPATPGFTILCSNQLSYDRRKGREKSRPSFRLSTHLPARRAFAFGARCFHFSATAIMPRLRLVTFNIAHGRGLTPIQGLTSQRKLRVNLRKIASLLDRLAPDVVALQEIDERSRWSGNFDHLDYLRVHTRFPHSVFGINNRRAGLLNLCYGNAVLSRHSVRAAETVVFGQRNLGEKGFLYVEFDVAGRCLPLVNLHLHFGSRAQRLRQLERLLGWLREKHRLHRDRWAVPPIICGGSGGPPAACGVSGKSLPGGRGGDRHEVFFRASFVVRRFFCDRQGLGHG